MNTTATDPTRVARGAADETAGAALPAIAKRLEALCDLGTLADAERERQSIRAPFTGQVLARVPVAVAEDVDEAMRRARGARQAWVAVGAGERCRVLLRLHDLIADRVEDALDLLQLETGKARRHAFEEIVDVLSVCRYYGRTAPRLLRPHRRHGALPLFTSTMEYRHPRGTVGVIVPWNYPLSLAVGDVIPALAAGNAVILKPDLQTSLTALWVADLLREAGLPLDVFQVVTGDGPGTGGAVVDRVDYVSFTGGTATGRLVAERAAARLIGSSLELGGKNAMIVRADADLRRAVAGATRGCFANAGQLCLSIERLLVHAAVHDRFREEFVAGVRALRLGAAFDNEADVGSLTSEAQLRKVEAHVADAVARGATVLAGGAARPDIGPFFFEPTVLADVTPEMRVYAEETFGPVVTVYRVGSDDEAVERANSTCYGLNASIWSRDIETAVSMARRIEAGTVNVNEAYAAGWGSLDAPMGGFKESGLGRRHGVEGLLKYTEAQTVAVQRGLPVDFAARRFDRGRQRALIRRALMTLRRLPARR